MLSKREFIQRGVTTLVTLAIVNELPLMAADATGSKKKKKKKAETTRIPIGIQLYSVREECQKDLTATIAAVAKMGYKGVEFAGYYGKDAKALKTILDSNGLQCCGTHIGLETLLGDNLAKTIEFNKIIGNKFLIVPGLDDKYRASKKAWQETAKLFNEISEKVKSEGMRVGYHNHTIEFSVLDGELPWDTFFGNTKSEVVMQFDTGNAMHGGGDATIYLKKYPGRAATVHLKPFSKAKPNALIGDDELPWPQIFNLCETQSKTEWYIVEYESDAYSPLVSVEKTLQRLKEWGKG